MNVDLSLLAQIGIVLSVTIGIGIVIKFSLKQKSSKNVLKVENNSGIIAGEINNHGSISNKK
jgi:hypothetical protein